MESFLACREPPVGRSNRVTPDNPPVIGGEIPCRCNETDWNWLAVPIADHPLGSTQSVTKNMRWRDDVNQVQSESEVDAI